MAAPLRVGQYVRFKDNASYSGVIFEFQDNGAVAGLKSISQKLKDSGVPTDETHEPVENLQLVSSDLAIGDKAYLLGDGNEFYGTIFEFVDDGMVAGLKDLSAKLVGLGCGDETHEPVEGLAKLD